MLRSLGLAALLAHAHCVAAGPDDAAALAAAEFGIAVDAVAGTERALRCVGACGEVTRLERSLEGSGFHRRLVTRVAASWPSPPGGDEAAGCTLALLESLPPGAYADAYELAAAERRGAVPPARVFGDVNIERPAPECAASVVALLAPVALGRVAGSQRLHAEARVAMPVHARYPAPAQPPDTTARVALPPPRVLLRCGDGAWRAATLTEDAAASAPVVWQVPAGNAAHALAVELATAAAGLAGALMVLIRLAAR